MMVLCSAANAQVTANPSIANNAAFTGPVDRITPPIRRADEVVGYATAPSVSGEWLTVRSAVLAGDAPGALHVYRKDGSRWVHHQTISSPDIRPIDDGFGLTSSIDGETMVVGAPDFEVDGVRSGAALVYRFSGGQWALSSIIKCPDPDISGSFGHHVALARGTIVVGEARENWPSIWSPNKAAYIFVESNDAWDLQATITAPDDVFEQTFAQGSHGFGGGVALSGDTVALAARNRVYVYRRVGLIWRAEQRLDAPRDPGDHGEYGAIFARRIDLDADVLVVGALRAGGRVPDMGAVFVYRRAGESWHQEAKLTASDGSSGASFGHGVAVYGDTIVAGAFGSPFENNDFVGAAYVFRRVSGGWSQSSKIVPPAPSTQRFTAYEVAMDGADIVLSGGAAPNPERSDYVWTVNISPAPRLASPDQE